MCVESSRRHPYLVHEVLDISVHVHGVFVSWSHDHDRLALLVETARVHLTRGVFLLDSVHLTRQHLNERGGRQHVGERNDVTLTMMSDVTVGR